LYHVAVHVLAHRLLEHIRRQQGLHAGERVGVAVSGGIDSVALLRLLLELHLELGIALSVVHFNHRLRGAESDGDEEFVANIAGEHDLEFYVEREDVSEHARDEGVSLETAARELRYGFFRSLIGAQGLKPDFSENHSRGPEGPPFHAHPNGAAESRALAKLDKVATGHTLDDQAETVLMRAIRGAGLKGLAAIYPRIEVEDEHGELCGEIVRPLLAFRRRELEQYLQEIGQDWREDASNSDTSFTRNRIRKLLMPMLEKELNPAAAENLAELAEIARGEEDYWDNEVAGWMGTGVHWSEPEWAQKARTASGLTQIGIGQSRAVDSEPDLQSRIDHAPWLVMNASVDLFWLLSEPLAVQRRVIKAIGEHAGFPLEFKHVEEILRFAAEEAGTGKKLSLPSGWTLERQSHELVFVTPDLREASTPQDYEYEMAIPGEVVVAETGTIFEVQLVPGGTHAGYNPEQFLDAGSLSAPLKVRNWRAGDRYWPNHTKSPKKIKELLHERHLEHQQRKLWPVVVSGDQIVWMRGFPVPAQFAAKSGRDAILITEKPLESAG
jgi:tRNA(Ile)-lysidine synthase